MKDALPIHILKCGIPYMQYHKVRIDLNFKKNIELSTQTNRPIRYNIHENCHPDYREKMKDNSYKLSFFIFQNQYAWKNCFGFYHPVYKIICLDDSKHSYLKLNKNIYKIICDFYTFLENENWINKLIFWELELLKLIGYDLELKNIVSEEIINDKSFTLKDSPSYLKEIKVETVLDKIRGMI